MAGLTQVLDSFRENLDKFPFVPLDPDESHDVGGLLGGGEVD